MKSLIFLALIVVCLAPVYAQSAAKGSASRSTSSQVTKAVMSAQDNPVEIGKVSWGRDFELALQQSAKTNKPVMVLFQEVPGCAGCQAFGKEVLSEPLVVEAAEELFVPVVVFNNRSSGSDAEILKRYKEPAWNYQVIRFLDSEGKDIIPRKDGINSVGGVATRMIQALNSANQTAPKYLQSLAAANGASRLAQVAFSMHCFWTGEYELGNIDGVVETQAGWLDGHEVTLVQYDPKQISLDSIAKKASQVQCANKVYTSKGSSLAGLPGGKLDSSYRPASSSDQKRQLSRLSAIKQLPGINAMQLTKINALAPRNTAQAFQWLSPRQRKVLAKSIR